MTLPTITATAADAKALLNAAALLYDNPEWQKWLKVDGAADPVAAAKEHIWIREIKPREKPDGSLDWKRPVALVAFTGEMQHPILAVESTNLLGEEGTIDLIIEANTPAGFIDKTGEAYIWFLNQVGAVKAEIFKLIGKPGYLNVQNITTPGPMRSDEVENSLDGDYWQIFYALEYR